MMTPATSLILFKLVLVTGLAAWLTLVAWNNIRAFAGGVAAVGGMMSMQLFDQAPAVPSPLLARRVHGAGWHRLVYSLVLAIEWGVAALLWYAAFGFGGAILGASDIAGAIVRANLALSAFIAMTFVMTLGGAWFAYYIRQESLQITHFVLIAVAIVATLAVNAA
jgi:predicted small integral membrane protein